MKRFGCSVKLWIVSSWELFELHNMEHFFIVVHHEFYFLAFMALNLVWLVCLVKLCVAKNSLTNNIFLCSVICETFLISENVHFLGETICSLVFILQKIWFVCTCTLAFFSEIDISRWLHLTWLIDCVWFNFSAWIKSRL